MTAAIESVSARSLSPEDFVRTYVAENTPVILTDAIPATWSRALAWTPGKIVERAPPNAMVRVAPLMADGRDKWLEPADLWPGAGQLKPLPGVLHADRVLAVAAARIDVPIEDFAASLRGEGNLPNLYADGASNLEHSFSFLASDVPQAPEVGSCLKYLRTHLWLGSATVSTLHVDNYENLFVQLVGEKEFILCPPGDSAHLVDGRLRKAYATWKATGAGSGEDAAVDVKAEFERFTEEVKTITTRPSDEDLLQLYAFFKQATVGDARGSRPSLWDLKARYKHDKWSAKQGMKSQDAMLEYIKIARRLIGKSATESQQKAGGKVGGGCFERTADGLSQEAVMNYAAYDIHKPSPEYAERAAKLRKVVVRVRQGEVLYLPFGWWHEVTARPASNGLCASAACMFDPFFVRLQPKGTAKLGPLLPNPKYDKLCKGLGLADSDSDEAPKAAAQKTGATQKAAAPSPVASREAVRSRPPMASTGCLDFLRRPARATRHKAPATAPAAPSTPTIPSACEDTLPCNPSSLPEQAVPSESVAEALATGSPPRRPPSFHDVAGRAVQWVVLSVSAAGAALGLAYLIRKYFGGTRQGTRP